MKISELPEDFKRYILVVSSGSRYPVTGFQKTTIIDSRNTFVELPDGSTINKAFIVEFKIDIEATKDFVEKNKDKIKLYQKE